jgi:hypothetical protein
MSAPSSEHLAVLFERELRSLEPVKDADRPKRPPSTTPKVSQELEAQVAEFASQSRKSGRTPEEMLVALKKLLSSVAPEVPGSRRNEFVSQVTGRAIDAFFER